MIGTSFLTLFDIDRDELETLFSLADELRLSDQYRPLRGTSIALIFQKPSLRTRVSFEVGVTQLGGTPIVLGDESIGIGQREPVEDVAGVLGRYVDAIVARVFEHELLETMAKSGVPIVNALSDLSHPCQILADLYTLRAHGRLQKGVKVAYVGDGNNVANSWIEAASLLPIDLVIACPEGYDPDAATLARARAAGVGSIEIVRDPAQAVHNADAVYTDVWTSMGQEAERQARLEAFKGYCVNGELMSLAHRDALFMHCLPAHRGEEVSAEVIEGERSVIFDQAEARLHMQKALLARLVDRAQGDREAVEHRRMPTHAILSPR